jgi:hypothetical protein
LVQIHFVLIGEGSSDTGLIAYLEQLCIYVGADEVSGTSPDFQRLDERIGTNIEAKMKATLVLEPSANLIFIHRDSDSRNPEPKYVEIALAVEACEYTGSYVAIVPVQETEAWLLLNELAIRQVAQRPNGQIRLNLPRPRRVEALASPKEYLQETLAIACEQRGRRLARFKRDFPTHRRLLLERLPIGGPLEQVPAWLQLREDIRMAIEALRELAETA